MLIFAFFSPSRSFAGILERPRSALAILLLVACSIAVHVTIHSKIDMAAQVRLSAAKLDEQSKESKVSDHDVEQKAQQSLNIRRIGGYVGYVLGIPLALLVLSFVLWLLLGAWSEGLGFRKCYAIASYVALPFALRQLLAIPVVLSYSSIDPEHTWGLFKSSLAVLIPSSPVIPASFLLDPFWMWTGALAGLAGRAMGRGKTRSTIVGVVVWLLLASVGRFL